MKSDISIIREWAMPSKHTFTILPIRKLLNSEITDGLWIDPFCGYNSPAKIRNDLNPNVPAEYHMNAIEFLRMFEPNSVDGVLFDPPYSPRQVRECYDEIGTDIPFDGRSSFWSDAKKRSPTS